uniref:NADH:ubiquinone reductase (H(+)-translocating) n=1 Tax=Euseius nicholsi TaxID=702746 RepID=A0A0U1ZE99_9ACAR|nr:NADH dehydrogenase subunit 5 [Euseius nicholsi]
MQVSLVLMFLAITLSALGFMAGILENFYILDYNIYLFDFFYEFKLYFYFDYIANLFLLVVSLISMATFLYSKSYMDSDKNRNKFVVLTFLFVMSMFMVVISMNMYIILVGWDCLGVVSYFLVIHYYSDNSDYSGIVTLMTNRLGDVAMIFCLYLFIFYNSMDFFIMNSESDVVVILMIFLFMCAFTKSAQYPFSVWLPLAMAAPTPISALVHSSTLVTAGVYLFIRFEFMFSFQWFMLDSLLILIGLTMMVASLGALFDLDIKKIVAYSTLSQLGLMMMSVVMGDSYLSFFHILTHALFKALLFFCSGIFIHSCFDNRDIRIVLVMIEINMLVVVVFFICSLSLAGFPFLSGFYSKDLILEYVYLNNFNLFYVLLLIINTLITGIYSFRLIYYAMLMAKTNMKYSMCQDWLLISNSMFYLFLGVLFLEECLSWILLEKFNIMYFNMYIKMLNILLILISVIFIYKWDILTFNLMCLINIFSSMFYLTSFQGYKFNLFLQNSYYLYYYSFYMLESVIFTNISGLFYLVIFMIILYKIEDFYNMFKLLFYFCIIVY